MPSDSTGMEAWVWRLGHEVRQANDTRRSHERQESKAPSEQEIIYRRLGGMMTRSRDSERSGGGNDGGNSCDSDNDKRRRLDGKRFGKDREERQREHAIRNDGRATDALFTIRDVRRCTSEEKTQGGKKAGEMTGRKGKSEDGQCYKAGTKMMIEAPRSGSGSVS